VALGLSQLKKLGANLARRREIAARYTSAFREVAGIIPPSVRPDVKPAWHLYPIRVDRSKLTADRGHVFRALRAENIGKATSCSYGGLRHRVFAPFETETALP